MTVGIHASSAELEWVVSGRFGGRMIELGWQGSL